MKEYKSFGYDYTPLAIAVIIVIYSVLGYIFDSSYDNPISRAFVENNFEYILGLCVVLVLYSFNIISVDKKGIKKTLFFIPVITKNYTWSQIKHYAHVKEEWDNSTTFQFKRTYKTIETIWFINFNDRVCLRVKKNRKKMEELMAEVDKFEDKFEIELKYRDPFFTSSGLRKVKYPKEETKN